MHFAPELGAPGAPRRDPEKVVERNCDRPAESHIRRPRRPNTGARSGAPPDAAPGAIAPSPASRVPDGSQGSARRRQLAALGLLGASPAMRVRHLGVHDEPGRVVMREMD